MSEEVDEQCVICFEAPKCPVQLGPCRHEFCATCIVPWAIEKRTCPLCREEIQQLGESIVERLPKNSQGSVTIISTFTVESDAIRIHIPSLEEAVLTTEPDEALDALEKRVAHSAHALWIERYPSTAPIHDTVYVMDRNTLREESIPFTSKVFMILRPLSRRQTHVAFTVNFRSRHWETSLRRASDDNQIPLGQALSALDEFLERRASDQPDSDWPIHWSQFRSSRMWRNSQYNIDDIERRFSRLLGQSDELSRPVHMSPIVSDHDTETWHRVRSILPGQSRIDAVYNDEMAFMPTQALSYILHGIELESQILSQVDPPRIVESLD